MKTLVGNAFTVCENGDVICITTNGEVRDNGHAVMGRGIAEFARDTFEGIDLILGKYLNEYGNRCFRLGHYIYNGKSITLSSFPTKYNWREPSDLRLVEKSCYEIMQMADKFSWNRVYVPMPGGGNGGLEWSDIEPVVSMLDSRFIVVSLNELDFSTQKTLF